jgi:hypothetical protein
MTKRLATAVTACVLAAAGHAQQTAAQQKATQQKGGDLGYTDTPMLPDGKWHVHDPARPHPPVVTPGAKPGDPPSDADILFDGKSLSKWMQKGKDGKLVDPKWPVRDGYFEVDARHGDLVTKELFGDCQLHVEWAAPAEVKNSSQGRGNSGIFLMSSFEVQVLDSYNNPTYADGQAGAIYGQWPPLVNATRPPGEWQAYDIVFEAPRFENGKLVKPAYETIILNGVLVQNHQAIQGPTMHRQLAHYAPMAPEMPLSLQDHNTPVHYRNIWIRKIGEYDRPEK